MKTVKKSLIASIALFCALLLASCSPASTSVTPSVDPSASDAAEGATQGVAPSITPDSSAGTQPEYQPAPSGKEFLLDASGNVIQRSDVRDYSLMWWRDGFNKGGKWQMNMQTGYYGLAINTLSGKIMNLGVINEQISQTDAARADNALIEALDGVTTSYFATLDGKDKQYTTTEAIGGGSISSRILEAGQYVSRIDVMKLKFKDVSAVGRVEIAAMPKYLALELGFFSPDQKRNDLGAGISLDFGSKYSVVYSSERAVTLKKENGEGFSIIVPEDAELKAKNSQVTVIRSLKIKANDLDALSIIIIPSANASGQDAVNYLAAEQLKADARQISPYEGKSQKTKLDIAKGYLSVDMSRMSSNRSLDFQDEVKLDELDRLKFTVTNPTNADISLPVLFVKEGDFAVEGMSCMLRDAQTGEPTGHYVQTCRNWHGYTTDKNGNYAAMNDPRRIWSGTWFHGYTVIDVPAGKSVTYELTVAYPKWGGVFACSHSQLCLAGWGGNYQQWETSTVGSFSDSFCYDIEKAHGTSATINDVLPLLSYGKNGGKYGWSNGVSGGDLFALYGKNGKEVPLKQITTRFIKQGPCINEVKYSAITKDESVKVDITVNMGRTNDAAKATYTLKYEFLKDVEFSRLSFFSLGADKYNTSFSSITIGSADGEEGFTLGGKQYNGTLDIDYNNAKEGYLYSDSQQRIEIGGEGLFVLEQDSRLYDYNYGKPGARMMNMLSWSAEINGKHFSKPSVSIKVSKASYGAYNIHCAIVELSAPAEVGNTIKKGSTVEGIVQYIPLPTHVGEGENGYYGEDEAIKALPSDNFIKSLAMHFVKGEKYSISVQEGEPVSLYPAVISVKDDAASVTVNGGAGYVALTFSGASSYSGYILEQKMGDDWVKVDQSVYGNDYWQVWYDAISKSYQHTYNVPCLPDGTQQFRFLKK